MTPKIFELIKELIVAKENNLVNLIERKVGPHEFLLGIQVKRIGPNTEKALERVRDRIENHYGCPCDIDNEKFQIITSVPYNAYLFIRLETQEFKVQEGKPFKLRKRAKGG